MSEYAHTVTELREEKFLVEALREMGYHPEVLSQGAKLNSYYSEQEAKVALVIIRWRELPAAYGDIGFVRQPDRRFGMVGDEKREVVKTFVRPAGSIAISRAEEKPPCRKRPSRLPSTSRAIQLSI